MKNRDKFTLKQNVSYSQVIYQRLTVLSASDTQMYCGMYCVEVFPVHVKNIYGVVMISVQLILPLTLIATWYTCIFYSLAKVSITASSH